MFRRSAVVIIATLVASLLIVPAAAGRASVDRIEDIGTVLAVARTADFPLASLMRADCEFVVRVERPDGSATETMRCTLSDEPVMVPAFQGTAPASAFRDAGGPCTWSSDYWFARDGSTVHAASFSYVVAPSGSVRATAEYPAEPLSCGE